MVTNGRISSTQLALIDPTHYAAPGCATAWKRWSADLVALGYPALTVGSAADAAYRSYAWQEYRYAIFLRDGRPVAARPGTSNHGYGMAVDLGNYYRYPHSVLVKTGKKFGFIFDTPSEAWHVRFTGAPDYRPLAGTTPTPLEEIDMADFLLLYNTQTKKRAVTVPGQYFREITEAEALVAGDVLRNIRNLSASTSQASLTENVATVQWDFLRGMVPTGGVDAGALAAALAPLLAPHLAGVSKVELEQALTACATDIIAKIPTTFRAA